MMSTPRCWNYCTSYRTFETEQTIGRRASIIETIWIMNNHCPTNHSSPLSIEPLKTNSWYTSEAAYSAAAAPFVNRNHPFATWHHSVPSAILRAALIIFQRNLQLFNLYDVFIITRSRQFQKYAKTPRRRWSFLDWNLVIWWQLVSV